MFSIRILSNFNLKILQIISQVPKLSKQMQKQGIDYKAALFDKYKFVKKLKTGGFGSVYIAQDIKNKKEKYAIKVIPLKHQRYAKIEKNLYSLFQEHKFTHGFAKLVEYGKKKQSYFCVMELLGEDLQQVTYKFKKLSLKSAIMIGLQAVDRIQALHKIGYLHRDIKPDNLMTGRKDNNKVIYLIDFGLAKQKDQKMASDEANKAVGTLGYMSVDAHLGKLLGRKDDLESLIYTILYFITGTLPWMNMKVNSPTDYHKIKQMKGRLEKYYNSPGTPKIPVEIFDVLGYVRSLKRESAPDYLSIKYKLLEVLNKIKESNDFHFDWCGKNENIDESPRQKERVEMKKHNQNVVEKEIYEVYKFIDHQKAQKLQKKQKSQESSTKFIKQKDQFVKFLKHQKKNAIKSEKIDQKQQKHIQKAQQNQIQLKTQQRPNSAVKNVGKVLQNRPNSVNHSQQINQRMNPWQQQMEKISKMGFQAPRIVINKTAKHKI